MLKQCFCGAEVDDQSGRKSLAAICDGVPAGVRVTSGDVAVAHIVVAESAVPTTAELRRFLLEWVPAAMVPAIYAQNTGESASGIGVEGEGEYVGVEGIGTYRLGTGVSGTSTQGVGVGGEADDGTGVQGITATGVGVSGLESDGRDQFFCGGGSSGKVRAVRRPR